MALDFTFTPRAAEKLQDFMNKKPDNLAIRLQVRRGAGGVEWRMTMEPHSPEAVVIAGIPVLIDPDSEECLNGLALDWVQTAQGEGFAVFEQAVRQSDGPS